MKNNEIFKESEKYMPGGVNSPVRAFKGVNLNPPVIKSGKGVIIKDEDDNEYIDFEELLKKSMESKMQSMLKNADKKSKRVIDDEEAFDLFGLD